MSIEIERKFLVHPKSFNLPDKYLELLIQSSWAAKVRQGYLQSDDTSEVIRVRTVDMLKDRYVCPPNLYGVLTIKSATSGMTRTENEWKVKVHIADDLLEEASIESLVDKLRFRIPLDNKLWEIDVFLGEHKPLIIAEIELESENEKIIIPDWVGPEVTDFPEFYNKNLHTMRYRANPLFINLEANKISETGE